MIDKLGRKPMLLAGSALMFAAMVIVGVIVAKFRHDWEHHAVAGKQFSQDIHVCSSFLEIILTKSV